MIKEIKNSPAKCVLYYVSQAEHEDKDLMDNIKKECADYKKQKYQPVIFISGKESLYDCMYHLVKHNRQLIATHPERFMSVSKN